MRGIHPTASRNLRLRAVQTLEFVMHSPSSIVMPRSRFCASVTFNLNKNICGRRSVGSFTISHSIEPSDHGPKWKKLYGCRMLDVTIPLLKQSSWCHFLNTPLSLLDKQRSGRKLTPKTRKIRLYRRNWRIKAYVQLPEKEGGLKTHIFPMDSAVGPSSVEGWWETTFWN